jgi:hypothetical protein
MQHASNVTHLHNNAGRQQAVTGREAKPKLLDQLRKLSAPAITTTEPSRPIAIGLNAPLTTLFGIPSLPISSNPGTKSEMSRNFWGTKMLRQR